jgi:simple sugar transport system ATP-binding protein
MNNPPAIDLEHIVKTFGDFQALDNVDLTFAKGEVHALLGENGAGKSSLMNIVAGLYAPDSGTISVSGRPVLISGPAVARRLGIGMVHQHFKLVHKFSVLENVMLSNPNGSYRNNRASVRDRVLKAAQSVGFSIDLDRTVESLSVAERQRVEILKVLVAGASVVILDEPTAVLTDDESHQLFTAMRGLVASGQHTVIFVTHKLVEALNYADRITVMRGGRIIKTVDPSEVNANELTTMIVGAAIATASQRTTSIGGPLLTVRDVGHRQSDGTRLLEKVNFSVRSGEIYGIAGIGGNGQTTLVEVLTGLVPVTSGEIHLEGVGEVTNHSPERMRRHGVGCVPADRHSYALAGDLPICDNYGISGVLAGTFGSGFRLDRANMIKRTLEAVDAFNILGVRRPTQKAGLLSGGNAQKLVIAREMSRSPSLIIAHSPSRGLDVRASASVHATLRIARDRGAGVLLISEDLDEITLLSDRVGVMNRGTIAAQFDAPADRDAIGKAMVGHA